MMARGATLFAGPGEAARFHGFRWPQLRYLI